jgi:hypothetical protein
VGCEGEPGRGGGLAWLSSGDRWPTGTQRRRVLARIGEAGRLPGAGGTGRGVDR